MVPISAFPPALLPPLSPAIIRALAALLLLAAPAGAGARDSLGVFDDWGAFRDPPRGDAPARCYAIAQPHRASAAGGYMTIGYWPASGVRGQFHARLPAALAAGGSASVTIGSRRFALAGNGGPLLWAADARGDAAIVAALRGGGVLRLSAGRYTAEYRLRGAATAIDSAALACARG